MCLVTLNQGVSSIAVGLKRIYNRRRTFYFPNHGHEDDKHR